MNYPCREADGEPRVAPVYVVWDGEVTIDAPIEVVWRHALDYASWQNYSIRERICGEPGGEGEVVRLKKEEAGLNLPPYYARTVKLDPPRRVIWKTYRDTPDYFGIVEFRFREEGGRTHFFNSVLYEYLVPYRHESELVAFYEQRSAMVAAALAATGPKLKKLAEGGA